MFGLTGILIALVILTIVLAGVFLVRPSITVEPTGKILAFVGLCVLPVLCIGTGMSFHMQRSQQTSSCISCHSMASHGQSLHLEDPKYIPAQHFQNHFVPPDKACYTCHTDYTIYGPWKSRVDGLRYVYMTYIGTVPKTIHYRGKYSNLQCLHCHAGARDFEEHLKQMPPIDELTTNRISCLSSGCHDMIHNASEVGHLKMWNGGATSASLASGSSSPAPAKAEPPANAGSSKAKAAGSAGGATATGGKAVFDSHGCSGCHGEGGGGGSGPALSHISGQYPPAKLTALLKAPTAKMKAAGMVPLTLSAGDMKSLVSYVSSLGGGPASAATPSASTSSSPAPAKAEPAANAGSSKAKAAGSAGGATATGGKAIFDSHGCSGCHGESGSGGSGPALTHVSNQYPPAKLTALLKAPTAKMKAAGMVPLTLSAGDIKSLVSYVSSLGGASAAPAAKPASGASSPAPAEAEPDETAGSPELTGEAIFKAHKCDSCHGTNGVGGTAPRIGGQNSSYLVNQLLAFRAGTRADATKMTSIAKQLDKEQIRAVAAFLSSQ